MYFHTKIICAGGEERICPALGGAKEEAVNTCKNLLVYSAMSLDAFVGNKKICQMAYLPSARSLRPKVVDRYQNYDTQ